MAYPGFQRVGCLRSGPIRKVGGRGGPGGGHSASGPIPLFGTQKISILHTRARMSLKYMPTKVNLFSTPPPKSATGNSVLRSLLERSDIIANFQNPDVLPYTKVAK